VIDSGDVCTSNLTLSLVDGAASSIRSYMQNSVYVMWFRH
jgi:hypothetical protein